MGVGGEGRGDRRAAGVGRHDGATGEGAAGAGRGGGGEGDGPAGQRVGLIVRHLRGEVGGEGGADGHLLAAARRGDDRVRLGLVGADGADGRRAWQPALIDAARAVRCGRGGQRQGADGGVAVGEGGGAGQERDGLGGAAVGAERAEQRRRVDDVALRIAIADAGAAGRIADQIVPAADERIADVGAGRRGVARDDRVRQGQRPRVQGPCGATIAGVVASDRRVRRRRCAAIDQDGAEDEGGGLTRVAGDRRVGQGDRATIAEERRAFLWAGKDRAIAADRARRDRQRAVVVERAAAPEASHRHVADEGIARQGEGAVIDDAPGR